MLRPLPFTEALANIKTWYGEKVASCDEGAGYSVRNSNTIE
jgi:hypothetical protein